MYSRVRRHRRIIQEYLCRYGKGVGRSHTHPEEGRRQAHRTREEANSDTAERREGEEAQRSAKTGSQTRPSWFHKYWTWARACTLVNFSKVGVHFSEVFCQSFKGFGHFFIGFGQFFKGTGQFFKGTGQFSNVLVNLS